jgi:hypothetical protein
MHHRCFVKEFSSHPIKRAAIDHSRVQNDTMLVEWSAESDKRNSPLVNKDLHEKEMLL